MSRLGQDVDIVTKNLNKLCRLTPEGYMIQIDQKQFEGREAAVPFNPDKTQNLGSNPSMMGAGGKQYGLAKDVEKIFSKVC